MKAGTLFSGIGAPECAAPWLDWRWCAEIDPFASAVHAARFPGVVNLGDVEQIDAGTVEPVDLIVFGSPCQSFSVAGKRLGLDDPRGNLALVGLRLIGRIRPRWVVWENVPGVLSSDGGRDFGAFLGLLGELGYGFAYAVLDAQHFGVPQRRRRVFVVGCAGSWQRAAAVLFEPESLRGDPAPRREAGERIARPIASCAPGGSGYRAAADTADNLIAKSIPASSQMAHREDADTLIAFSAKDDGSDAGDVSPTLRAGMHHGKQGNGGVMPAIAHSLNAHAGRIDGESETFIAHSLRADGFDASEDGPGRDTPLVTAFAGMAYAGWAPPSCPVSEDIALPLDATRAQAIADPISANEEPFVAAVIGQNGSDIQIGGGDTIGAMSTSQRSGHGDTIVAHRLRADGFDASEDGTGRGTSIIPVQCNGSNVGTDLPSLRAGNQHITGGGPAVMQPVAFTASEQANGYAWERPVYPTLHGQVPNDTSNIQQGIRQGMSVRRLTPRECERLQGFPDDFTAITYRGKPAADGPRYRALGNSMAVPVIGWILQRVRLVDEGAP